jgi:COMPASS component SWD3
LGGAFGIGGTEGFIVSGSEDGEIFFWDVRTKEVVQRVSGHEGVVCWVDTSPSISGTIVSGGLDGTVRIWVDVNEDDEVADGLKVKQENGGIGFDHDDDVAMDGVKVENDDAEYGNDTPRDQSVDGERTPEEHVTDKEPTQDKMEED